MADNQSISEILVGNYNLCKFKISFFVGSRIVKWNEIVSILTWWRP